MYGSRMRGTTLYICRQHVHAVASVERLNRLPARQWLLALKQTEGRFNAAELGLFRLRDIRDFASREQHFIHARSSKVLRLACRLKWFFVNSPRGNSPRISF